MTAAVETTRQAPGGLRPLDPTRDLGAVADLIAEAFAEELDARGRAALREMRWMAFFRPFVWWWSQADPTFRETFNGFVWEEAGAEGKGGRIAGNVSLNRAPGSRDRWIICNVVVEEAMRGQGIGRRLTEAAVAEAKSLGARGVVLQVHQDNLPALQLYTSLGFQEVAGETDLRMETVREVAHLDAPGYEFRRWRPEDGEATYQLAMQAIAQARRWLRPIRPSEFRRDWLSRLGQSLADLLAGRRVYRLVALREGRLVALMTVSAAYRRGEHRLDLLVHADHTGQLEASLVSRALYMLSAIPSRPVEIAVEKGHVAALKVLRENGFVENRTLLTLSRELG